MRTYSYTTATAEERFIQFETGGRLLAFLRLSLPTVAPIFGELSGAAMIRGVHVYGQSELWRGWYASGTASGFWATVN